MAFADELLVFGVQHALIANNAFTMPAHVVQQVEHHHMRIEQKQFTTTRATTSGVIGIAYSHIVQPFFEADRQVLSNIVWYVDKGLPSNRFHPITVVVVQDDKHVGVFTGATRYESFEDQIGIFVFFAPISKVVVSGLIHNRNVFSERVLYAFDKIVFTKGRLTCRHGVTFFSVQVVSNGKFNFFSKKIKDI